MNIQLKRIDHSELEFFRQKQQESFTHGVLERFGTAAAAPIPSENDLDQALADCSNDIFIITGDGVPAGGAIIKKTADKEYSLELFFIFKEFINKKIGFAAWQAIEKHYPDAEMWQTCTPYFERRNLHFYINKCGFKIVEFFCEYHRENHDLTAKFKDINTSGFFRFEKTIKH